MQQPSGLMHQDEIVLNAPAPNERTLVCANKLRHPWSKPQRHDLGDKLSKAMDKTDRSELPDVNRILHLGDKSDERGIKPVQRSSCITKLNLNSRRDISLDDCPTSTEEFPG
jgi:hypothetical protein